MSKKVIIFMILIFFISLFLLAFIFLEDEHEIIEVYSTIVKRKTIESRVYAAGKIHPMRKFRLSAKIAGEITDILVEKGDFVKKEQILVHLNKETFESDRLIAKASLLSAKATLKRAEKEYIRQKKLISKNMTTLSEFELSREQYEIAESVFKSSKATLLRAESDLSKTTLKSPIDGKVLEIKKEKGEIALGSDVQADIIMVIADMSGLKAIVKVNENDIASVNLNDVVDIKIEAVNIENIIGKVSEIEGFAETENEESQKSVTNFKVVIMLDRTYPEILPGMSVNVEILTERHKNVLSLPIRCVTVRPDSQIPGINEKNDGNNNKSNALKEVVFRIEKDKVTPVPIKIGISSETDFEILSGINEGDIIVTGDYQALSTRLNSGSLVKIINTEN